MKKMFFIQFLLALATTVFGQNQHFIDSVVPLIRNDNSRSDLQIFYDLGFEYTRTDHSRSLEYFAKGLSIAERLGDSLMIVKCSRMTGHILVYAARQVEAVAILEKTLTKAKRLGYKREEGLVLGILAVVHTYMAHFDRGLEYNFQALELWRQQKDSKQIAEVLLNIGFVHYKVENHDKAIDYFYQSLSISESDKALDGLAQLSYSNIGMANISKGNLPEAERWLTKSIKLCEPGCPPSLLVTSEYGLGYVALHENDLVAAEYHFKRSLEVALKMEDHRFEVENLIVLANTKRLQRDYDTSVSLLKQSWALCVNGGYRNLLADSYYQFFQVYKSIQKPDLAAGFLEKYVNLRDSIYSAEVKNKIMVAQTEFESRENKLLIAQKEELLARQKLQTQLVVIICLLSLTIAIGLFILLRRKRRTNAVLDQRVIERTRELEHNKTAFERAYHEQTQLLAKTSRSIKSVLATQKGLRATMDRVNEATEDTQTEKHLEQELTKLTEHLEKIREKAELTKIVIPSSDEKVINPDR
jgi:tetratricopeptide (TPR) repeat protein